MRSWTKSGHLAALIGAALWLVMCASDERFGAATNAISVTTTGGAPSTIANPLPLDASVGGGGNGSTTAIY